MHGSVAIIGGTSWLPYVTLTERKLVRGPADRADVSRPRPGMLAQRWERQAMRHLYAGHHSYRLVEAHQRRVAGVRNRQGAPAFTNIRASRQQAPEKLSCQHQVCVTAQPTGARFTQAKVVRAHQACASVRHRLLGIL